MVALTAAATLLALSLSASSAYAHNASVPGSTMHGPPSGTWYQDDDHSVHALFRRHDKRAGSSPAIGSQEWAKQYPDGVPDPTTCPKAWMDALTSAVAAGQIPDIPASQSTSGETPVYPDPYNAQRNDPSVCSANDYLCRNPEDIWDGPEGYMGLGFDDGPAGGSADLYAYLKEIKQKATHFMIGTNILHNPELFKSVYNDLGGDIAVHTWTHPMMTTQTNEQIVCELGWTMQIIFDSTGGKLPKYWRPPYGDIDLRVTRVANHVFGMQAILWNHDTMDWSMEYNGTTLDTIQSQMGEWLALPKNPGLIILEHELSADTIQAFKNAWPLVQQNGWKTKPQTALFGGPYQDAKSNDPAFGKQLANALVSSSVVSASKATSSGAVSAHGTPTSASTGGTASTQKKSSSGPGVASPSLFTCAILSLAVYVFT